MSNESKFSQAESDRRQQLKDRKPLVYAKVMKYEEQLAKGKSIAMIQIQPSYVCNFHCKHCSVSNFRKQSRKAMTLNNIEHLCNQADDYGLAQIDLTGGEPLAMRNLVGILSAIGTERFYVSLATNGWYIENLQIAEWLHVMGVDRILLSLDSLNPEEHDKMRNQIGSWRHAVEAIKHITNANLDLKFTSVITHQRVHTRELEDFIQWSKDMGGRIEALPPRLVGEWKGRNDLLLTADDFKFLQDTYGLQFHTSPHYGINFGCVAVKKILTVTAFGDVLPCIWMYYSLGNVMDTPLKDIIEKGMKYFGKKHDTCYLADDKDFIEQYDKVTTGRQLPIAIESVWDKEVL